MDYSSSSSSSQYKQREWLLPSSSTSQPERTIELLDASQEEHEDDQETRRGNNFDVIQREHMFDKVVTPSDVGKLNRLVIPKQHAEKYFPLDSSTNEQKGLLLNFEDRTGKPWRFRYSYWNSSQSYVMTKGWSRFVKEKKLDAGDIVSFQRGVEAKEKLFIDWRRRPDHQHNPFLSPSPHHHPPPVPHGAFSVPPFSIHSSIPGAFVLRSHPYPHPHPHLHHRPRVWDHHHHHHPSMNVMSMVPGSSTIGYGSVVNPYPTGSSNYSSGSGPLFLLRSSPSSSSATQLQQHHFIPQSCSSLASGGGDVIDQGMVQVQGEESGAEPMVFESVPVVQGKVAAKRLRLFGVNMDCPISHQPHDYDILSSGSASSSTPDHHQQHHP